MGESTALKYALLEQILQYLNEESDNIDLLQKIDPSQIPGLSLMTMVTFEGVPVLPPVINPLRKEELMVYKRQSLLAETRLRGQFRQSLLKQVQMVMNQIEEQHVSGRAAGESQDGAPPAFSQTLPFSFKRDAGTDNTGVSNNSSASGQESSVADVQPPVNEALQEDVDSTVSQSVAQVATISQQHSEIKEQDNVEDHTAAVVNAEIVEKQDGVTREGVEEAVEEAVQGSDDVLQEQTLSEGDLSGEIREEESLGGASSGGEENEDASQGLLQMRQKLAVTSQDSLTSHTQHLVLNMNKYGGVIPKHTPAFNVDQQTRPSGQSGAEAQKTQDNNSTSYKRSDSLAKRLPTFLRIQQSLARKLSNVLALQHDDFNGDNTLDSLSTLKSHDASLNTEFHAAVNYSEQPVSTTQSDGLSGLNDGANKVGESTNNPSDKLTVENTDTKPQPDATKPQGLVTEAPVSWEATPEQHELRESGARRVGGSSAGLASTSNSLASGGTFGSDDLNKTVISQEESKSRSSATPNTTATELDEGSALSPAPKSIDDYSSGSKPSATSEERDQSGSKPSTDSKASREDSEHKDGGPGEDNVTSSEHEHNVTSSEPEVNTTSSEADVRPSDYANSSAESGQNAQAHSEPDIQAYIKPRAPPHTQPNPTPRTPPTYDECNKENRNPKCLLDRVAFNVDFTPDSTPLKKPPDGAGGRVQQFFADNSLSEAWLSRLEEKYPLENLDPFKGTSVKPKAERNRAQLDANDHSPDPSKTSILSHISFAESVDPVDERNKRGEKAASLVDRHGKQDVNTNSDAIRHDASKAVAVHMERSLETHELYTESTELAQYMATSLDTDPSQASTLPRTRREYQQTAVYEGHNVSCKETSVVVSPGLRGSYTLDQPSPALVASHAQDVAYSSSKRGTKVQGAKSKSQGKWKALKKKSVALECPKSQLTRSMEDLNIRPVQRKLEYQAPAAKQAYHQEIHPKQPDYQPQTYEAQLSNDTDNVIVTPLPNDDEESVPIPDVALECNPLAAHHPQGSSRLPLGDLDPVEAERHGKQEHLRRYLDNLTSSMPVGDNGEALSDNMSEQEQRDVGDVELRNLQQPDQFSDEGLGNENEALATDEDLFRMQETAFAKQRQQLLEEQQLQLALLMERQQQQQQLYLRHSAARRTSQEKRTKSRLDRRSKDSGAQRPATSRGPSLPHTGPGHLADLGAHSHTARSLPTLPNVNQNQLLASLAQFLGQQSSVNCGASLNSSLLCQGGPNVGTGGCSEMLSVSGLSQAMYSRPQSVLQGPLTSTLQSGVLPPVTATSLRYTTHNTSQLTNTGPAGMTSQHNPGQQRRNPNSRVGGELRPDSQQSTISTLTSQPAQAGNVAQDGYNMSMDFQNRPYSAPVPQMNYSMEGGFPNPQQDPNGGVYFSPSAIAKLLAQAGFSINSAGNQQQTQSPQGKQHQQQHPDHSYSSPVAQRYPPANTHYDSRSPLLNQPHLAGCGRYQHPAPQQQQPGPADTSFQSSGGGERSVHFASPLHCPAHAHTAWAEQEASYVMNGSYSEGPQYQAGYSSGLQELPTELQDKLSRLPALVKGYLVRRLKRTDRVQYLIKSISDMAEFVLRFAQESPVKRGVYSEQDKVLQRRVLDQLTANMYEIHHTAASIGDTADFALRFAQESPVKRGVYSEQDKVLQRRVLDQLTANMYEIHHIFFRLPVHERMDIIRLDRQARRERLFKPPHVAPQSQEKKLSAASVKTIERKEKAAQAEATVPPAPRPKSAPPPNTAHTTSRARSADERALKPLQTRHQIRHPAGIKPIKATDRVHHKDPNVKPAVPRKTQAQSRTDAVGKARTGAKKPVTSTVARKTAPAPVKQPVRKVARGNRDDSHTIT